MQPNKNIRFVRACRGEEKGRKMQNGLIIAEGIKGNWWPFANISGKAEELGGRVALLVIGRRGEGMNGMDVGFQNLTSYLLSPGTCQGSLSNNLLLRGEKATAASQQQFSSQVKYKLILFSVHLHNSRKVYSSVSTHKKRMIFRITLRDTLKAF